MVITVASEHVCKTILVWNTQNHFKSMKLTFFVA
jgi:hypothetical protein